MCRVKAAATAASKALPPRSSTAMPTALATQWVVATTPKVPAISGRVVNMTAPVGRFGGRRRGRGGGPGECGKS